MTAGEIAVAAGLTRASVSTTLCGSGTRRMASGSASRCAATTARFLAWPSAGPGTDTWSPRQAPTKRRACGI
jgi:hypothetical protein